MAGRENKVRSHGVFQLRPGLVEPHFDRQNIQDRAGLAEMIKKELARFPYSGEKAACLVPESCLKIFVFSFEALPLSEKEKTKLFLWRVRKQLPLVAENIKLSYQVINSNAPVKVLVSLARSTVLAEYENVFAAAGIKVGVLTTPTLSLLNLIDWEKEKDFLLVSVEADATSLVAVTGGSLSLFRLKPHPGETMGPVFDRSKVETVVTEIENTIHFLEDREKRSLNSLWLHSSSAEFQEALQSELRERFSIPLQQLDLPFPAGWSVSERAFLAPLFGQVR